MRDEWEKVGTGEFVICICYSCKIPRKYTCLLLSFDSLFIFAFGISFKILEHQSGISEESKERGGDGRRWDGM